MMVIVLLNLSKQLLGCPGGDVMQTNSGNKNEQIHCSDMLTI